MCGAQLLIVATFCSPPLLAVGYGKNALIDLENPAFAECASQSACDGVAKNAAGEPLGTLTYVADSNLVRIPCCHHSIYLQELKQDVQCIGVV